jgi:ATP-binding cassette subfamily F protein uup
MIWLEEFLRDYAGAVVFVTHDRVFLQNVATRIVELDRGTLTSWPGDYATFVRRKDEWLATEATHNDKFDKRLAKEEAWLRQGVKARRTRDEGRVKALLAMRQDRAERRSLVGAVRLQAEASERPGQLVFEAKGVAKSFGPKAIARDFSIRIIRGDRIGLIGPNGSGKTTLLRMLIGETAPDAGEIRLGENVQVAYYDQQREQLDPERSVFDTVGEGNDTVTVNGRTQHVHGYLRDFLFPPERAESPVKALSGGERNRLLLARLFTRPANVLVLDEPTNDLDIETLELLESYLIDWPGTLLLVSHDRAFIDHVVTSTLAFEGGGRIREYVGGYEDWLRQRDAPMVAARGPLAGKPVGHPPPTIAPSPVGAPTAAVSGATRTSPPKADATQPARVSPETAAKAKKATKAAPGAGKKKLTFREQQELRAVPERIAALEAEQGQLNASVSAPDFYQSGAAAIAKTLERLDAIQQELLAAYARWDELDSRGKS